MCSIVHGGFCLLVGSNETWARHEILLLPQIHAHSATDGVFHVRVYLLTSCLGSDDLGTICERSSDDPTELPFNGWSSLVNVPSH